MGSSMRAFAVAFLATLLLSGVVEPSGFREEFKEMPAYLPERLPGGRISDLLHAGRGRRLLDTSSSSGSGGLRVALKHRDSGLVNISVAERLQRAVARSNSRTKALAKVLGGADVAAPTDFQSPVAIGNGEYVMALQLGTPAKTYSVIVDTGSDLTWIQCAPCTNCFQQPNPLFNPSQSSSYSALGCSNSLCQMLPVVEACQPNCEYFYQYGDQSTTVGIFSSELVTMGMTGGGSQQVSVSFGCGHDNQGSFTGVDGLVGLGQGPISFTSQLSYLFGNVFSYCLVSLIDTPQQTSPLLFGNGAVPSGGSVLYTPLLQNAKHPTYYYVQLTGISVGGNQLSIPQSTFSIDSSGSGGTILDSGTTITQLVSPAYKVVVQAFQSLLQYPQVSGSPAGLDLCFDVSSAGSDTAIKVPTLTFHFDQADLTLPAENYFVAVDNRGTLCLAMAGSYGFTIFGNIQQQNYQVLYDRSGQRIGFKKLQCDSL